MSGLNHFCSSGSHERCPGYYRMTHPCGCQCHQTPASAAYVHARLGDIELILQGLDQNVHTALTLNAFRAGAIVAHIERVQQKLSMLRFIAAPLDAPDGT